MLGLLEIRTEILAAVATHPVLHDQLVLKGGNALALVHKVGMRTSLDIDYSMEDDLEDPESFGLILRDALQARFESHELIVFDFRFEPRPRSKETSRAWGGYNAVFKLIPSGLAESLGHVDALRRRAIHVDEDPQSSRRFTIEISKYEFCGDQAEVPIGDGVVCRVYSLDLVAAEKLRSLCQQMSEYSRRAHPAPRSRDFYDLYALLTDGGVDLAHPDLHGLLQASFAQKEVPIELIPLLANYVEFHEQDWQQVLNAIPSRRPRDFAFYTDFVLAETAKLKPLWDKDPPR